MKNEIISRVLDDIGIEKASYIICVAGIFTFLGLAVGIATSSNIKS